MENSLTKESIMPTPTNLIAEEPSTSFMPSICMPMCDYQSSAPICSRQKCRACQLDIECEEESTLFEIHSI